MQCISSQRRVWAAVLLLANSLFPMTGISAPQSTWQSLFDGKTLGSWKSANFGGEGDVRVVDGEIRVDAGAMLSGITWTGAALPKYDYEISLEAQKRSGSDFFCGLTFPVGDSNCSFIVGGWGGGLVGLSSIDGLDASENETTGLMDFPSGRWYRIRVRVTKARIEAWIDDKQMVNVSITGRTISIRPEVDLSKPLGIATYETEAAFREIRMRRLD